VKNEISEVMARWVRSEELAVQHVTKPGQRVPVTGVTGSEGPFDGFRRDTGLDIWVFGDVGVVVVTEKIMGADLVKDCCGGECQGQANPKAAVFGQYVTHYSSEL